MEKFLQGTGGLQNRELLMVHYLQQANYIPALQLNQGLKLNLVVSDHTVRRQIPKRDAVLWGLKPGPSLCTPRVIQKKILENVFIWLEDNAQAN